MDTKPPAEQPIPLGSLNPTDFDTAIEVTDTPGAPPVEDDTLRLPRGGLVALRRSGGLRFTTRTVVVYHDGRVATDGAPPTRRATRCLSEAEMAEVWTALAASDLRRLPPVQGRQGADAYAYEIVARLGGRTYAAEVYDGGIPASLAQLIALLLRLRPAD